MNKKTEELINELKECIEIKKYINENEEQFFEHTLESYIKFLMKEKEIKKIDVVKNSNLSEVYTYQIMAGMKNPDREKLICIIFALKLNLNEANTLLNIAGKAELYAKNKRDSIIIFALNKKLDINNTNDILYELGENILQ